MSKAAHIAAIEWAIAKGYVLSVGDYSEDEYDLEYSANRAAILEAVQATDLPNVAIFRPNQTDTSAEAHGWDYLLTFSVIDDGIPEETVADWTIPRDDAAQWRIDAEREFDAVVTGRAAA